MDESIKVVYVQPDNYEQYRTVLQPDQYQKVSHRIRLPKNFYSAGWMSRVWDVDWKSLPQLPDHLLPENAYDIYDN